MNDPHVCRHAPEEACSCGRPKPRQTNDQLAQQASRLAQLRMGLYENGAAAPSEADIAVVLAAGPKDARVAGELLSRWMSAGQLPGVAPQRTPRYRMRDGSAAGLGGAA